MPERPLSQDPDESPQDESAAEQIARIERELQEQSAEGQARLADDVNRFFSRPPHPGPVPDVLRGPGHSPAPAKAPGTMASIAGMAAGWGLAFDFIVTIFAGLGLGWLFDRWRGTAPWGILAGLALGFVASIFRIIRASQRTDRIERLKRGAP
jgi:F0F1-type ATP synthase assembly protein I